MARTQGTSARPQHLIAAAAICALAAVSAVAIGRVFEGTSSTYELVATALASALLACLLERRNLLLASLVSVVGMGVAIGWFVFPETTWFGLPTLETLRASIEAAGLVGEQARIQVAPTEPLAPLLLAALTGTWAAIFSAHALAFRAGSPILALLPPVALVAFADTVLEEVVRPLYGLAFLIAAAAVLFADSLRRVQGWGPVWNGPSRHTRLTSSAGRSARKVAAATLVVAAVSPLLIPGFGSKAILDFSSAGDDIVRLDPLVSVAASLNRDEPIDVFVVDTPTPLYWRMVALPDFDGTTWRPDAFPATVPVEPNASLVPMALPSPDAPGVEEPIEVSFQVANDLALPWLPMPYMPLSTDAQAEGMRWDAEGGALQLNDPIEAGISYSVTSQVVRPTPEDLRATSITPIPDVPRYTELPDGLPPQIQELATELTVDDETRYDKVISIQEHFTAPLSPFTYDETVRPRADSQALLTFLFDEVNGQRGFCQQFAAAMAVMLRTIGIPARLAEGFSSGSFDDATDSLRVSTDNAHVWVEVLFPGYGWLAFEPTRGLADAAPYPYIDPTSADCKGRQCGSPGRGQGGPGLGAAAADDPLASGIARRRLADIRSGFREGSNDPLTIPPLPAPPASRFSARDVLAAALVAGVLTLAAIPIVRAWRRRSRLRRAAHEPRTLISATYDVFTERAGDLGLPRGAGETIDEYRARVMSSERLTTDDLGLLSRLATDAAYAPTELASTQAQSATDAASVVLKDLRRNASVKERIGGQYRRR